MGQYFSGQHGQIFIDADNSGSPTTKVASLRNWQLSMALNVLDSTTMQSTDRTLVHGVRSYTGSASMLYYNDNGTNNVSSIIQNSFFAAKSSNTDPTSSTFGQNTEPELVLLRLRLAEGTSTYDIDCHCFITSFSITCSVGEVVSADISFEGTGLPVNMGMVA